MVKKWSTRITSFQEGGKEIIFFSLKLYFGIIQWAVNHFKELRGHEFVKKNYKQRFVFANKVRKRKKKSWHTGLCNKTLDAQYRNSRLSAETGKLDRTGNFIDALTRATHEAEILVSVQPVHMAFAPLLRWASCTVIVNWIIRTLGFTGPLCF